MANPVPVSQAPIAFTPNSSGKLPGGLLTAQAGAAFDALARDFVGPSWPTAAGLGVTSLAGITAYNTTTHQLARRSLDDTTWIIIGIFNETTYTFSIAGAGLPAGYFSKTDCTSVVFTKTAAGTISVKAGTIVDVWGTTVTFAAATAVTMPTLVTGTDYAVYACTDGTARADASFTAPTGYTTANSCKIGGFHYPGYVTAPI